MVVKLCLQHDSVARVHLPHVTLVELGPWDRQTDRQTDRSICLMPPMGEASTVASVTALGRPETIVNRNINIISSHAEILVYLMSKNGLETAMSRLVGPHGLYEFNGFAGSASG